MKLKLTSVSNYIAKKRLKMKNQIVKQMRFAQFIFTIILELIFFLGIGCNSDESTEPEGEDGDN
jgi:hypothetical protein